MRVCLFAFLLYFPPTPPSVSVGVSVGYLQGVAGVDDDGRDGVGVDGERAHGLASVNTNHTHVVART
jgi:hypothetical protein